MFTCGTTKKYRKRRNYMNKNEEVKLILKEIEHYLQFDTIQREYAEKGILKALNIIEREEKKHEIG